MPRRKKPQPRPARAPYVLTLSSRRVTRQTLPETVVPYLRMSGRWLEEHGFPIGAGVQVVVERGRVTLISEAAEPAGPIAAARDADRERPQVARSKVSKITFK